MPVTIDEVNGDIIAGGQDSEGELVLRGNEDQDRIRLTAGDGDVLVGGNGADGNLALFPASRDNANITQATIKLDAAKASIFSGGQNTDGLLTLLNKNRQPRISLQGGPGRANIGGSGVDGALHLFPAASILFGGPTIQLDGGKADIIAGGADQSGNLSLRGKDGKERVRLNAEGAAMIGSNGLTGQVMLHPPGVDTPTGINATAILQAATTGFTPGVTPGGKLTLRSGEAKDRVRLDGEGGNVWVGGKGANGDLVLFSAKGDNASLSQATVHLDGASATIFAGGKGGDPDGKGVEGNLLLRSDEGQQRVLLSGDKGRACLGGKGGDGDVMVFNRHGDHANAEDAIIRLDGLRATISAGGDGGEGDQFGTAGSLHLRNGKGKPRIRLEGGSGSVCVGGNDTGGNNTGGDVFVFPSNSDNVTEKQATIHLDGEKGAILVQNESYCQEFEFEDLDGVEPGAVVVMGPTGRLTACRKSEDKAVVGVVADAGDYRGGMILGRRANRRHPTFPIAIIGRVFCKVAADTHGVNVGDLLMTSSTLGQARVGGTTGAVIGKALASVPTGVETALIPILVTLM